MAQEAAALVVVHGQAQGLAAGVEDGAAGPGPADHGGQHPAGALLHGVGAHLDVLHPPHGILAGAVLGQLRDLVGRPHAGGGAAADDGVGQAPGVEAAEHRLEEGPAGGRRRHDHDAPQFQAGQGVDEGRQVGDGRGGPHSGAALVHLDHHSHAGPRRAHGPGQAPDDVLGVRGHRQPRPRRQVGEPLQLDPPHDVVGDEDIAADAAVDHDLGLAELLADDAHGAALHLHAGDGQALVGLDVGTQADMMPVAVGLGAVEVLLQGVEVDEQEGGVEVVDAHGRLPPGGALTIDRVGSKGQDGACRPRTRLPSMPACPWTRSPESPPPSCAPSWPAAPMRWTRPSAPWPRASER